MKSTPFTEMATAFRGHIVRLWTLRYPGTQSEAAAALTEAAINLGYVTRNRPVPGAALLSWASNPAETPLWAAQTALALMFSIGWKPESNQDWCGMSALIFRANRTLPLEQLVASLPDSIDRQVATGWFVAAIEEDASYRYNRKST
ncbi:TPA: hypothetical protein ACIUB0_003778 [Salmonella enterica subsp. enterica serovar Enteritidis]|uniref:hypothetical protein n=1 Tax=Escherichia coli TaxID=562 RepID=UPI0017536FEE|nr:hypothetical protein [Escherichia coli]EEY2622397.1 hypothetical protein [Escherichia coli]EEZ9016174.1 hypothetical protein [Escherichia coli]EIM2892229.1 hypothetical protein [Escherichia coli]EIY1822760.1 hypothetical protein [Escherichia coli]EJC7923869.1 hypothetical protein [Escherichia coli]